MAADDWAWGNFVPTTPEGGSGVPRRALIYRCSIAVHEPINRKPRAKGGIPAQRILGSHQLSHTVSGCGFFHVGELRTAIDLAEKIAALPVDWTAGGLGEPTTEQMSAGPLVQQLYDDVAKRDRHA